MKISLRKQSFDRYFFLIVVAVLLSILVFSYKTGAVIMGLDNASPFFGVKFLTQKLSGIGVLIFSGNLPVVLFSEVALKLGITPSVISYLYYSFCFLSGIIFQLLISKSILVILNLKKNYIYVLLLSFLLICGNLAVIWIFSQPILSFAAGFGSLFSIVYALNFCKSRNKQILLLIPYSLLFFTATVNLVTFSQLLLQIILLSVFMYFLQKEEKYSLKDFIKKKSIVFIYIISFIVFVIVTYTFLSRLSGSSLIDNFNQYVENLKNNELSQTTTDSLFESELRNSLFNSIRFSTGWVELHDKDNNTVFENYDLFESKIYIFIGVIPVLLSLFILLFNIIRKNLTKGEVKVISYSFIFFIIYSLFFSKYFLQVYQSVPLIQHALRWPSSKLWGGYLFLYINLFAVSIAILFKRVTTNVYVNNILFIWFIAVLIMYLYPNYKDGIFSNSVQNKIPDSYFALDSYINPDDNVLVIPDPQISYFREYSWGYYGADFLKYISDGKFYDASNVFELDFNYDDLINSYEKCDKEVLENFDYIIFYKDMKDVKEVINNCDRELNLETVEDNSNYSLFKIL